MWGVFDPRSALRAPESERLAGVRRGTVLGQGGAMSCSYTRAAVPQCTGHSDVSRIESGERRWDGVEFVAVAKAQKEDD